MSALVYVPLVHIYISYTKVQVGKDQEKVQSEKNSHRGGKETNQQSGTDTKKTFRKLNETRLSPNGRV